MVSQIKHFDHQNEIFDSKREKVSQSHETREKQTPTFQKNDSNSEEIKCISCREKTARTGELTERTCRKLPPC